MKNILIIGATSALVEATARLWAQEGHHLFLVARDEERIQVIAQDLKVRGAASVHLNVFDVNNFSEHQKLIEQANKALGSIDIAFIGHGSLGDQKRCENDFDSILNQLNTNAISVISLLTHITPYFEAQQSGTIAVISSVAGDRGRQSNYVYGTAKGALSIFLQGLRQRLHPSGINVLTIKPGFVDTPMTREFKKNLLWAKPEIVAKKIHRAVLKRRNVVYAPWFWWGIMAIVCFIPEGIYKRFRF